MKKIDASTSSRTVKLIAIAALALSALTAAGCSAPKPGGTQNRAPLSLPQASQFKTGTCSTIADPVLALGRFTYDKAGIASLSTEDRAAMVAEGEKLVTAREGADPELYGKMSELLMSIGFVRIRVGAQYDPALLTDVESARMTLQSTCTTA